MFKTRLISCFKAPRSERVVYPIDNPPSVSQRRENKNLYHGFLRTRRSFRPSSLNWFYDTGV
jgi:hypothetical protein